MFVLIISWCFHVKEHDLQIKNDWRVWRLHVRKVYPNSNIIFCLGPKVLFWCCKELETKVSNSVEFHPQDHNESQLFFSSVQGLYDITIGVRKTGVKPTLLNVIKGHSCQAEMFIR